MGWKFRIELDETNGPSYIEVRPHRQYFGRDPNAFPVELDFEIDEPVYITRCDMDELPLGRSAVVTSSAFAPNGVGQLIATVDPHLYGTNEERKQNGKFPFFKLEWGVWNCLVEF
jgi:hypothetical protein